MQNVQTELLHFYWGLQSLPWDTIAKYAATSGVVSVAIQWVKRMIETHKDIDLKLHKVMGLVGGFSFLPTFINWLASDQGQSFKAVVPQQFAAIFTGAVLLHAFVGKLVVSPVYRRTLQTVQTWRKVYVQIKVEAANASAISNPNLTLNSSVSTPEPTVAPAPTPPEPEEPAPLVISG